MSEQKQHSMEPLVDGLTDEEQESVRIICAHKWESGTPEAFELVAALRNSRNGAPLYDYVHFKHLTDIIKKLALDKSDGWISVEERLPNVSLPMDCMIWGCRWIA
jgi:hypothetical protein